MQRNIIQTHLAKNHVTVMQILHTAPRFVTFHLIYDLEKSNSSVFIVPKKHKSFKYVVSLLSPLAKKHVTQQQTWQEC